MQFSFRAKNARRTLPEINLTSLVDIIFNLLLFFMLTATVADKQGIDISLPTATSADPLSNEQTLTIVLADSGEIYVKGEMKTKMQLDQILEEISSQQDKKVIVQADRKVAYGAVVEILDLVRAKGIEKVSIATEPSS